MTQEVAKQRKLGQKESAAPEKPSEVDYGKMYHWGWEVIKLAPGLFVVSTLASILSPLLTQLSVVYASEFPHVLANEEVKFPMSLIIPDGKLQAAAGFLVVGLLVIGFSFLSRYLSTLFTNVTASRLQQTLHDKLFSLGSNYHRKNDLGRNTAIVCRFSIGAQLMLSQLYITPINQAIALIGALYWISRSLNQIALPGSWVAGLMTLLVITPLMGLKLTGWLRTAFSELRDSELSYMNEFTNSAAAPLEVQLMGAEGQRSAAFGARLQEYFQRQLQAAVKKDLTTQLQAAIEILLKTIFICAAVIFSFYNPQDVERTISSIIVFLTIIPQAVGPLRSLVSFITGIHTSWPSVESVVSLLEAEPEVRESKNAKALQPGNSTVKFDKVRFAYTEEGKPIVDDLSFEFPENSITAIVGPSGAGKSSILNLLVRQRDPQGGSILIGDQELKELKFKSLRENVVKISQFPLFIADTIRANFHLGNPKATDDEIRAVSKKVGLWEALETAAGKGNDPLEYKLPRPASSGLNGGSLRRLAVARGLLLQPSVMLIDEPTTGLDPTSKPSLAKELKEGCQGQTVLLVDHDMEFVSRVADQICILKDGKFVQVGSPAELAEQPGVFKDLLQAWNAVPHDEDEQVDIAQGSMPRKPEADPVAPK